MISLSVAHDVDVGTWTHDRNDDKAIRPHEGRKT